jgi:adenylosuccinate synthase
MSVTAIVGAQWGDEGKGRIIDYLAQEADVVIRFQGGDNAGHTVINEYGKHALHLIPSGIFNPRTQNIIGSGCVVNPESLLKEMESLTAAGVDLHNLWISTRAQMLLPYHRQLDVLEEAARGKDTIGTTKRGIGPAYADKPRVPACAWATCCSRPGWRRGWTTRCAPSTARSRFWAATRSTARNSTPLHGLSRETGRPHHRHPAHDPPRHPDKKHILLEGQLGVMRDLDWGIYPYVTSSNPTASYAASGAGLPARTIDRVIGVVKAYSTAVGDGPFPVELHDADGEKLREIGGEFGATTGRPRRCGWFDGVAIGYAAWLNGMTGLAITKLDVLDASRHQSLHRLQTARRHRRHRHHARHARADAGDAGLRGVGRLADAPPRIAATGTICPRPPAPTCTASANWPGSRSTTCRWGRSGIRCLPFEQVVQVRKLNQMNIRWRPGAGDCDPRRPRVAGYAEHRPYCRERHWQADPQQHLGEQVVAAAPAPDCHAGQCTKFQEKVQAKSQSRDHCASPIIPATKMDTRRRKLSSRSNGRPKPPANSRLAKP